MEGLEVKFILKLLSILISVEKTYYYQDDFHISESHTMIIAVKKQFHRPKAYLNKDIETKVNEVYLFY